MGHVYADAEIVNPEKPTRRVKTKALIDTGATYTVISERISKELGLKMRGKKVVKTAKGPATLSVSYAEILIGKRSGVSTVLVSDELDQPLIGVVTLEIVGLTVDPTTGQLKEVEALLL
ncbi:MAG: retroviral-like aspartic protease family protein [archaeon]|nr:retroviral-like aspartic protease family protein [archaeon]MCP8314680.1 retroviral-like aspartic protease family protein [archaeon]